MSKSLPANPNLENLKKQAKTLRKAILEERTTARIQRIREQYPQLFEADKPITLRDAQHIIAQEYGCESWQELSAIVEQKRDFYTRFLKPFERLNSPEQNTVKPRNLFSDMVKSTMQDARREAMRLKHNVIGTEHLLLGIIRMGEGSGITILKSLNVDLDALKSQLEIRAENSATSHSNNEIPFTPRSKQMLEKAVAEARAFSPESESLTIGTAHLLLALVQEVESETAQVLKSFDADYARIKTIAESLSPEALIQ